VSSTAGRRSWLRNVPLPEPHLAGMATGIWLHRARPWELPGTRRGHRLAGSILVAAGSYLIVRAVQAARAIDVERPTRLLTAGPYAASRNPMYVGWTLLHLGAGVAGGSGWVLVTLPVAAVWTHREVAREERTLTERFGDEYRRYRLAVPRYLPTGPAGRRRSDKSVLVGVRGRR
jgi:protein-S-isoprenylcysteine O-methyltransferase Ste14